MSSSILSDIDYLELNRHPGTTGVVGKRFHADHDDVRLRVVYKPHGKVPINVSHRCPRDCMVVICIIEGLCSAL